MRTLFRLLVCACLWAPLSGQDATKHDSSVIDGVIAAQLLPEVTTRLRSELPATVAWGGYLAQRYGLREAGPDLVASWKRIRDWEQSDAQRSRLAVLDACVQLGVAMPPELLASNLDHLRVPATILLARAGKDGGALLFDLFRQLDGGRESMVWLACGNLLAQLRPPGFIAAVLERHQMLLSVTVRPGQPAEEASGIVGLRGPGHVGIAPSVAALATSLPPVPMYSLLDQPGLGDHVLALGATSVYWRRSESAVGNPVDGANHVANPGLARWNWLRSPVQATGFNPATSFEVRFTDADAYLQEVRSHADVLTKGFSELIGQLQKGGLLTAEEASAVKPNLLVVVDDQRGRDAVPLPELPFPVSR